MRGGAAAARRAAKSTPNASVWNLLLLGALTLVVLVLVAERSTVETTWGAAISEARLVAAVEERRGARTAEARRAETAEARRAGAGTAAVDGAGAGSRARSASRGDVRASKLKMIHVGKTGGQSAYDFLRRASSGSIEEFHMRQVDSPRVREEETARGPDGGAPVRTRRLPLTYPSPRGHPSSSSGCGTTT